MSDAAALIARLPPSLRARLWRTRRQRLATLARNVSLGVHVGQLLDGVAEAGVTLLPLKGALLAYTIYDDAGLRPMSDVDLLVRPAQLDVAVARLCALGFRPGTPATARWGPRHAHAVALVDPTRQLAVDLHHRLFHELDGDSEAEPFFTRAITLELHGKRRQVPSWEDSLFLAALHGAVDGFSGPAYWLLDFALLLERADFARAAAEAERRRLRIAFAVAVGLARRALPDLVPPPPWSLSSLRERLLAVTLGADPLAIPPSRPRHVAARLLLADGLGGVRELVRKLELRAVELYEQARSR